MCWFAGSQKWNLSELVGGNMTFVDYTGKKYVKMIAYIRDIEFESIIPNPDLVYLVDLGYSLGGGLLQTGEVGMIFYMDENGMTYDLGLYIFSDLIKSLFVGNALMPSGFYVYPLEILYDNMASVLAIEYQTTVPNIKYTGLFNQKKPKLLDIPVVYLLSDEIDLSMYPQGTPLLIFQPLSLD